MMDWATNYGLLATEKRDSLYRFRLAARVYRWDSNSSHNSLHWLSNSCIWGISRHAPGPPGRLLAYSPLGGYSSNLVMTLGAVLIAPRLWRW